MQPFNNPEVATGVKFVLTTQATDAETIPSWYMRSFVTGSSVNTPDVVDGGAVERSRKARDDEFLGDGFLRGGDAHERGNHKRMQDPRSQAWGDGNGLGDDGWQDCTPSTPCLHKNVEGSSGAGSYSARSQARWKKLRMRALSFTPGSDSMPLLRSKP